MKKEMIKSILENAFKQSTKTPSFWQLPKVLQIKYQLENAVSSKAVISLLEQHSVLIKEALGLTDEMFNSTVQAIKNLEGESSGN
ncbi:MAG: hypothetical protein B7Z60_09305 [Ferrovum sp. 37-45-19]|jgi:hypothetical protein|uniref:hypothetical protein n=1 Tax=Ferrovum sp. JA12 TaxID=1356299 RepID=UPI000703398D|nr:hypothetical protein [Ferrovum sp. JA12]OYV78677.1 MAG: hypothetical protein B7Z65_09295 [Ferrovum sp. 21-44-67]OYV93246.1 MAG: hypothetical protein B7Z60_09305 [Ferrovum sp. 37-45-19]OZB33205.1 MAG: hypothetical protein B7X47_04960 [Ferrovum sp. 34-44-207]HQT82361.1 hypothetical protein [Ferrovaceae bacterium]KRH79920.1 hypothetical protein FERRO_09970 [Ferrovum sp. JA12]